MVVLQKENNMSEKLTKKEKDFADEYLETGNGTQSVLQAYDTERTDTAGTIAHRNLKKDKIRQYLLDNASSAVSRITELSISAENESVRLHANKDILDRAGLKPVEEVDITSKGEKITTLTPEIEKKVLALEEDLKNNL